MWGFCAGWRFPVPDLPTILIVDDEKNTRDGLRDSLEDDFDVYTAAGEEAALEILKTDPADVMVTDLRLGADDGMELLEKALKLQRPPVCIMMTAYGSVDTAVEAMKRGAYDFVTKPINVDRLELLIKRALREQKVVKENRELRQQVDRRFGLDGVIGESLVMVEVMDTIRQVAASKATVLIEGESGTGKELAAHAIHQLSPRADRPFVAVHCKALSSTLLESELFGHERGAFTGATERRQGRFEQADGGTLFLDEIGEIDESTQVKILRVLGERTFERVGGNKTLKVDVRVLTATNRDLEAMVARGEFREDLFFRLNVVQITMPPLRSRKEDIPLMVQAFLRSAAEENGKPFREITSEAMRCLLDYNWPGNVRELRTAVEHGVVMASGKEIGIDDLPVRIRQATGVEISEAPRVYGEDPENDALNLHQTERALILRALQESGGNRTLAAKRLGISRRTLHRRLNQLSMRI